MNVLQIGLDKSLLKDKEMILDNTIDRMIILSEYISNLFIAVLVPKNEKEIEKNISKKIKVFSVPSTGKIPSLLKAYKICSRICKERNIDVISTQEPFICGLIGYMLKIRYKIPLNIQLHGEFIDDDLWIKQRKTNYFWNWLAKRLLKKADTIRTVNNDISEKIQKCGINPKKIYTFPVFMDVGNFDHVTELPIVDGNKPTILFVGFFRKLKGIDILILSANEVLKKIPDCVFVLVGDGPERSYLEELTHKLGISDNIIFIGEIPYENLPNYYKNCDIFVLPSRSESWGRVVLEALVNEKPVIVSDACAIADFVVLNELGLSFPVDNALELSNNIIFLLANREIAKKMGEKGKQVVLKRYSTKVIAPKYLDLWQKTVEEGQN